MSYKYIYYVSLLEEPWTSHFDCHTVATVHMTIKPLNLESISVFVAFLARRVVQRLCILVSRPGGIPSEKVISIVSIENTIHRIGKNTPTYY